MYDKLIATIEVANISIMPHSSHFLLRLYVNYRWISLEEKEERKHITVLAPTYLLLNIEENLEDWFEKILKIKLLPFRSTGIIWNTVLIFDIFLKSNLTAL